METEAGQLSRTALFQIKQDIVLEIVKLLLQSIENEMPRLFCELEKILKVAEIVPMVPEILALATDFQILFKLPPQDSIVLASVVHHLNTTDETIPKCFLNLNSKDFNNLNIETTLKSHNCKFMLQEQELSKVCELMRSKNFMATNFSFKTIGDFSDDLSNELTLELMAEEHGFLNPLLVCEFKAVRNLKLDFGAWEVVHLPDLRFEKIEGNQWEGVHYKVFEAEEEKISFLCQDINFAFPPSAR